MKSSNSQIQKSIVIDLKMGITIFILGGMILLSGLVTGAVARQIYPKKGIPPVNRHGSSLRQDVVSGNHNQEHISSGNTLNPQWVMHFGLDQSPGTSQLTDMVTDKAGNIYITGLTPVQPYGMGYLTLKYGAGGQLIWKALFKGNGPGDNQPEAIAVDRNGNVAVSGEAYDPATSTYDITTVYYNGQGQQQWSAVIPDSIFPTNTTSFDHVAAIGFDGSGNVYVAGSIRTGVSIDPKYSNKYASTDLLTIKYDGTDGKRLWMDLYDGGEKQSDRATGMVVDSAGDAWVTGASDTVITSNYHPLAEDFVTIKYQSDGTRDWVARYGNGDDDAASAIARGPHGGIYVTGTDDNANHSTIATANVDYLTIKYDSNGKQVWLKQLNGPYGGNDYATDIVVDHAGNVLVTGSTQAGQYEGDNDFMTIKYSASGDSIWAKTYRGAANGSSAFTLAVDAQNNVYITGYDYLAKVTQTEFGDDPNKITTVKYSSSGKLQWSKEQTQASAVQGSMSTSDIGKVVVNSNGQIVTACTNVLPGSDQVYAITSYDASNGNVNWHLNYDGGPSSDETAVKMVKDANGNIYVAGTSSRGYNYNSVPSNIYNDIFVTKFAQDGKTVWSTFTNIGNKSFDDEATGLAIDANGNVYVCGTTDSTGYTPNFFIVKYNDMGQLAWTRTYNGTAYRHIAVDKDNNLIVTGSSKQNQNYSSLVTFKYSPDGKNIIWSDSLPNYGPYTDPEHILSDASGNVYVGGISASSFMVVKYKSNQDTAWTLIGKDSPDVTLDKMTDMVMDANGNIYASGTVSGGFGDTNSMLVKVSSVGDTLWTKKVTNVLLNSLALDESGNLYAAGESANSSVGDILPSSVIKYSPDGKKLWSVSPVANITNITTDAKGNVFLTGTGPGLGQLGYDYFTSEYQADGTLEWMNQFDVASYDNNPVGIAVDADDNVTVAGYTGTRYTSGVDIFRYHYVTTPIAKEPVSAAPATFRLSQNYPNPFNPSTNISFKISTPGFVSLKIYDVLGREVATLVNRQMSPGSYNARWNASGFASGVYFYRLRAGNFVQVRKMLYLK